MKQLYGKKDLVAVLLFYKQFYQREKDTVFSRRMVACVFDESHTIETWTGLS